MPDPSAILTALPGIHATIVGIAGSAITAYALYARQELEKTKINIDSILEDLSEICTPQFVPDLQVQELLKEDELDWHGLGKSILYEAKSEHNAADEVLLNRLITLLYLSFTTYPFTGRTSVNIQEITEKFEAKKNAKRFDLSRLQELESRVSFLVWCWHIQKNNIIDLAKKTGEFETENNILQHRKQMDFNLRKLDLTDDQKQEVWNEWHAPNLQPKTDYVGITTDFFERAKRCNEALPPLRKLLIKHKTLKNIFMLQKTTKTILGTSALILLLGVFIPPIMLYAQKTHNLQWHENLEYALLIITGAPYFAAIKWLWDKTDEADQ